MTTSDLRGELAHQVAAFGHAQVGGDAAFVAAEDVPPQRRAVVHLTPRPHGIAAIRRLHLDHVGAKPREQAAGKRAGEHLTEFEHAQPVERAARLIRSLPGV